MTLYSSRLNKNLKILKKYNSTLLNIRKYNYKIKSNEDSEVILKILEPIVDKIKGKFSNNTTFDGEQVIIYLKRKYQNWKKFIEDLRILKEHIKSETINIDYKMFEILDNIANAIQAEGGSVFRKIRLFP